MNVLAKAVPQRGHEGNGFMMNKRKGNDGFEDSEVFKRRSLNSAKMRKRMAKIVTIVLEVLAVAVAAWVAYVYFLE